MHGEVWLPRTAQAGMMPRERRRLLTWMCAVGAAATARAEYRRCDADALSTTAIASGAARGLQAADVDGDGRADAVCAGGQQVTWHRLIGAAGASGQFGPGQALLSDPPAAAATAAAGALLHVVAAPWVCGSTARVGLLAPLPMAVACAAADLTVAACKPPTPSPSQLAGPSRPLRVTSTATAHRMWSQCRPAGDCRGTASSAGRVQVRRRAPSTMARRWLGRAAWQRWLPILTTTGGSTSSALGRRSSWYSATGPT